MTSSKITYVPSLAYFRFRAVELYIRFYNKALIPRDANQTWPGFQSHVCLAAAATLAFRPLLATLLWSTRSVAPWSFRQTSWQVIIFTNGPEEH